MYDMNNEWLEANASRVVSGDPEALRVARRIYESGDFDPGFGLALDAALQQHGALA